MRWLTILLALINRIRALTKLFSARNAQKITSNLLMVILCCAVSASAPALESDPLAGLKQFSDFSKIDIKRLLEGAILSERGPLMAFPNGISSQLCFAVPSSPAETVKHLQTWDPKRCGSLKVYASHRLNDPCELKEFSSLSLDLDPAKRPIKWFLDKTLATSDKSSELNLSQIEAHELAGCLSKDASPKSVGSCWASVLFARASSFQRNGFASMFPYEFDVESITPVLHLRSMLKEQVRVTPEFAILLQRSGLVNVASGFAPLRPSQYYWRLFDADHHATLSLGAVYVLEVGDRYQVLEVEYYVSGTYYTTATLYEVWPINYGGKTGSLVWSNVLCSAPALRYAAGIERLASGVILILEFKKMVSCFQNSFKTP
ncbi:MAG: hypothetical protein JJE30_04405 [Desulfuromonadales bacterium]|nr:hypothetical protein [Desulfuromonadales bacterium]